MYRWKGKSGREMLPAIARALFLVICAVLLSHCGQAPSISSAIDIPSAASNTPTADPDTRDMEPHTVTETLPPQSTYRGSGSM